MRIDKFLSNSGAGSRKEIKALIKNNAVSVGGKTIKDPSFKVDEDSSGVCVNGEYIMYKKYVYLMLNKPSGYVSAVFDKRLPVVCDLVDERYAHFDVFPVGRLDMDTEGLLVLTNDGALSHRLLSPKSHVDKQYFVRCEHAIDPSYETAFKDGVTLDDGYKTMSAAIEFLKDKNECLLTIREGKFHQVKRMFKAVGNTVIYLKRVKMGGLRLDDNLPLGAVRELTEDELSALKEEK